MIKGFYFITDKNLSRRGIINDALKAVGAGACAVQYRSKDMPTSKMINEALILRRICKRIPLIINDRVDIALAVNADGVHLGQDDMPVNIARRLLGRKKIIGLTVHSLAQAEVGVRLKVDYLGISPIFFTNTKVTTIRPVGLKLISLIRKRFKNIPIVAIGGIKLKDAEDVIASGADALCAISAVLKKKSLTEEINKFNRKINIGLACRSML
ncbi:MAG: thiamine phosphate synthase [Candidatus Omnitrophota bacterium]